MCLTLNTQSTIGRKNQIISHQDYHQEEVAETRISLGAENLGVAPNDQYN